MTIPPGFFVVDLDAQVEAEAGALPNIGQPRPRDGGRDAAGFTAEQWDHVQTLAWEGYWKRTHRPGEARDYSREDSGANDSPATEEDDMAKVMTADNMTERQQAVHDAWLELAKKHGRRPRTAELVDRAGIDTQHAGPAVITALKAISARGIKLPFADEAPPPRAPRIASLHELSATAARTARKQNDSAGGGVTPREDRQRPPSAVGSSAFLTALETRRADLVRALDAVDTLIALERAG